MSWLSANPSSNISTAVSKFNFSTPGGVSDIAKYGADFINTNSLIGKIAFLFMILILFVILLRFGIMLIGSVVSPSGKVVLIDGMAEATETQHIHQNPNVKGARPIIRSVDEDKGIEFTWSTWLFIDGKDEPGADTYRHIFHKGEGTLNSQNMCVSNNGPGMYLKYDPGTTNTNSGIDLHVRISTFADKAESIQVKSMPVGKWVSVILTCDGTSANVYVNGVLARRHKLSGVPKQNYGDIYVALRNGFRGKISDLRYYNYELSNFMINYTYMMGPNRRVVGKMLGDNSSGYMSSRWFFSGTEDATNPM